MARNDLRKGYSFRNISTATTTVVHSGAGILHSVSIGLAVISQSVTIYDNTAGSGTVIFKITWGLAIDSPPMCVILDASFGTGLTVVTSGASDLTLTYESD